MNTEICNVTRDFQMPGHGGKRTPGAGKQLGRPREKEPNAFGRWLDASGKDKAEVAAFLGVSASLLGQLSRGSAKPSLKVAVKIEELTEGAIHCSFWVKSEG